MQFHHYIGFFATKRMHVCMQERIFAPHCRADGKIGNSKTANATDQTKTSDKYRI